MKRTLPLLLFLLIAILAVFIVLGCTPDSEDYPQTGGDTESRGIIGIEVVESDGEQADRMKTVRFLVFKNVPVFPQLELNEKFDIPPKEPENNEISKFKILLEVTMRPSENKDIMVVAIVNEPTSQTAVLEAIGGYDLLSQLSLKMDDFVESDHLALQSGTGMPMTGITWTDLVFSTVAMAEANPASIELQRALSKVEFYVLKESGTDFDIAAGSTITLQNTYDKQFFVREHKPPHTFGHIQTVGISNLFEKIWNYTDPPMPIPQTGTHETGPLLCAFYTPERTCSASGNTDKLKAVIHLKSSSGEIRNSTLILDELTMQGISKKLDAIERNSIFRIFITVTEKDLVVSVRVLDWNNEEFEIEF